MITLLLSQALACRAYAEVASSASLISLTINGGGSGSDSALLVFDKAPSAPSIISNDNVNPIIAFPQAAALPTAVGKSDAQGVWQTLKLSQQATTLAISLTAPNPVRLLVERLSPTTFRLSTAGGTGAGASATSSSGSHTASMITSSSAGDEVFTVVPLKYADVSEVVGILTDDQTVKPNDSFVPQEPAFGSAGIGAGTSAPNPATTPFNPSTDNTPPSLGRAINGSIGIDRRLNAIILRGSAAEVAALEEKIRKIDLPVQSVVLETVFVELTDTAAQNVGIDLSNTNSQVVSATYGSGGLSGVSGLTHGLLSLSLQGAIYAQVQNGQGRIISKPKISAQSGSSAKIITGDALPILTNITLSGVNGVSQQVQYVTVGVTLQIAPRVTEDGFVSSHIFCEVSSVTGYSQGYPTISQREASTSATVGDGQSFIIGGLTEDSDLSTSSRPPGAGAVPILGSLMNHQTRTASKTQLYIVVTPHIVRGGEKEGMEAIRAADAAPKLRPRS